MCGKASMASFTMKTRHPPGYSDEHADIPALIMGNGPSLAKVEFDKLEGFRTFGMNAAYRYWQTIGWWPDYYVCLDCIVGQSHIDAISRLVAHSDSLGIRRFLLRFDTIRRLESQRDSSRISCYESLLADGILPKLRDVTTGSHTMLWAQSLGYSTILLAGVDCNYDEMVEGAVREDGHLVIKTSAPNPNYFFDDYQRPGDRYNQPNLTRHMHRTSWINCADKLRPETHVVNLNPQSCVDAFPFNFTSRSILQPGEVKRPTDPQSGDCRQNYHTAATLLHKTLDECRKYSINIDVSEIKLYVARRLSPSNSPRVDAWRQCDTIRLLDNRSQSSSSPPYLMVRLSPHEGLSLSFGSSLVKSAEISEDGFHLAIIDPEQTSRLCALLLDIHREFGSPSVTAWIGNALRTVWAVVYSALPWQARAKDWSSLATRLLWTTKNQR
jgi:hypothetical protein